MRGRGWRGRGRRRLSLREVETSGCVADACGERLVPVREEVVVEVVQDRRDDRGGHQRGPAPCEEALGGMRRGGVVVGVAALPGDELEQIARAPVVLSVQRPGWPAGPRHTHSARPVGVMG